MTCWSGLILVRFQIDRSCIDQVGESRAGNAVTVGTAAGAGGAMVTSSGMNTYKTGLSMAEFTGPFTAWVNRGNISGDQSPAYELLEIGHILGYRSQDSE